MNDTLRETCGVCGQPLVCAGSLDPKNKPDPHVVTEEPQADGDEILGAGISYASNIVNNGVRKQFMAFAQAIAARADAGSAKIEGVRKTLAGMDRSIEALNKCSVKDVGAIEALERKVGKLGKAIEGLENWQTRHPESHKAIRQTTDWLYDQVAMPTEVKPQPAIAQAPDSDGKLHDLISGVSVVRGKDNVGGVFHHQEYRYPHLTFAYWSGLELRPDFGGDRTPSSINGDTVTWVCDLSFPGGDK